MLPAYVRRHRGSDQGLVYLFVWVPPLAGKTQIFVWVTGGRVHSAVKHHSHSSVSFVRELSLDFTLMESELLGPQCYIFYMKFALNKMGVLAPVPAQCACANPVFHGTINCKEQRTPEHKKT